MGTGTSSLCSDDEANIGRAIGNRVYGSTRFCKHLQRASISQHCVPRAPINGSLAFWEFSSQQRSRSILSILVLVLPLSTLEVTLQWPKSNSPGSN